MILFYTRFRRMRDEDDLVDITFACEGKKLGAHKLVLYSCSPYFKELLKDNKSSHPIFFFHDISYDILKAILEYMYLGEVHITNENLKDFIRVAEALQIRGLSKDTATTDEEEENDRKRSNDDHIFSSHGKKLKLINEGSIAHALNDDDIEEEIHSRAQTKRETQSVQPKTESLEFLEDVQSIQQQQQAMKQQPHNITYMNMDTFSEKAVASQPSSHHATTREKLCIHFSKS
jgi:hypothetical protein